MAREAAADGVQGALRALFPLPPEAAPRTWARRGAAAVVQIAAVGLGAWVLLLRIPGSRPGTASPERSVSPPSLSVTATMAMQKHHAWPLPA